MLCSVSVHSLACGARPSYVATDHVTQTQLPVASLVASQVTECLFSKLFGGLHCMSPPAYQPGSNEAVCLYGAVFWVSLLRDTFLGPQPAAACCVRCAAERRPWRASLLLPALRDVLQRRLSGAAEAEVSRNGQRAALHVSGSRMGACNGEAATAFGTCKEAGAEGLTCGSHTALRVFPDQRVLLVACVACLEVVGIVC